MIVSLSESPSAKRRFQPSPIGEGLGEGDEVRTGSGRDLFCIWSRSKLTESYPVATAPGTYLIIILSLSAGQAARFDSLLSRL